MDNFVIATHVFTPGTSQALCNYLVKNKKNVLFIQHSIFGNILTWTFGMIDTFWKVLSSKKKYDLYIGFDNLNAFIGIWLRKIGVIPKVIFMTADYSHARFKNKILNSVYHWFDYYCLKNADFVWNSSSVMIKEREKRGISIKYRKKQIMVPDGTDEVKKISFKKRHRYEIVFVGHLKEGMGLEMLIESFPEVVKQITKAKLIIIGSGPIENKLRDKAKGQNIEFKGFIGNLDKVYSIITKSMIAIAPYDRNSLSENTDPGKVKLYLSAGLPMVLTRVPLIAREIEKYKCGIIIEPGNRKKLVLSIINLLKNEKTIKNYIDNVKNLSEKYKWSKIFTEALEKSNSFFQKK